MSRLHFHRDLLYGHSPQWWHKMLEDRPPCGVKFLLEGIHGRRLTRRTFKRKLQNFRKEHTDLRYWSSEETEAWLASTPTQRGGRREVTAQQLAREARRREA